MVKYNKIIQDLDEIWQYFNLHNKNLTKKQWYKILDLQDVIYELKLQIKTEE